MKDSTPSTDTLTITLRRTISEADHAGKIRYTGCSNFSGWHLMKSLAVSEKYGWTRYVAHQAYYSLVGREYEWELIDAAGGGSECGVRGLEPAGLGPADWEDPPRPTSSRRQPAAQQESL